MGTNYYMTSRSAPQPRAEAIHVGKSSCGWCFALHVMPEMGLTSWDDWLAVLSLPGSLVFDEYGVEVTLHKLVQVVMGRRHSDSKPDQAFLSQNHAEIGPNGLVRAQIDGQHCIGHGTGTWDLICGEFS